MIPQQLNSQLAGLIKAVLSEYLASSGEGRSITVSTRLAELQIDAPRDVSPPSESHQSPSNTTSAALKASVP